MDGNYLKWHINKILHKNKNRKVNHIFNFLLITLLCLVLLLPLYSQDSIKIIQTIQPYSTEEDDDDEILDIGLSLGNMFNLDVKVISATKKLQKLSDAPAIITVITAKQIKDRGYETIAEALNSVPGIDVITDYYQPNLGIRGINSGMRSYSRIVKVMINSQPVSNRSNSDNYLSKSLIPMHLIERIEVIKGPNSALYGADAYLGVVNIITKTGKNVKNGSVSLIGEFKAKNLTYDMNIIHGQSIKKIDYILGGSINKTDLSGLTPMDIPLQNAWKSSGLKTDNFISKPANFYGNFIYNEESWNIAIDGNLQYIDAYAEFADWAPLTHGNRYNFYNIFIRPRYYKKISDLFDINLSFAYSRLNPVKNEIFMIDILNDKIRTREVGYNSFDLKAEGVFNFKEKNYITLGVDFVLDKHIHQTFRNSMGLETAPVKTSEYPEKFTNFGLYIQTIINPFSFADNDIPFNITSGIRYDHHNIYDRNITWRAAAVYNFWAQNFIKILYGTSFKAPSSAQLFTNQINDEG